MTRTVTLVVALALAFAGVTALAAPAAAWGGCVPHPNWETLYDPVTGEPVINPVTGQPVRYATSYEMIC